MLPGTLMDLKSISWDKDDKHAIMINFYARLVFTYVTFPLMENFIPSLVSSFMLHTVGKK